MKNKVGITAKEAKRLSDESEVIIEEIYLRIEENAKRNMTSLTYFLQGDFSEYALEKILAYLKEDGFTTAVNNGVELVISW